ncbi:MAG: hypothetical protein JXX28_08250 [Deltaproteobacteria bacterium]|nr:hypothetical protein [Deltaproteobacteria bacterium]
MSQHAFTATCAPALEQILAEELRRLGIVPNHVERSAVHFEGGLEQGYRAALHSRVASRVLLTLRRLHVPTANALYLGVKKMPWAEHLGPDQTLAVNFVGVSENIRNTHFGALRVKDGVVDHFRERSGARPSIDTQAPDIQIHVHLRDIKATVSLDLSGYPLHLRGLDRDGGPAPLRENLAAALLQLAGWEERAKAGEPLLDPLCGSGTFLTEAALIARGIAPGLSRREWGFTRWRGHDDDLWRRLVREAQEQIRPLGPTRLYGFDRDRDQVTRTRNNLKRAGLTEGADVNVGQLRDAAPPFGVPPGLLITNPPYGERLGDLDEVEQTYSLLGDVMRRRFLGWTGFVLAGSTQLAKWIGLRAARRHIIYNGPLECRLLELPISAKPVARDGAQQRP